MEKNNQIASQRETQNNIIELGVVSVATRGQGDNKEPIGDGLPPGAGGISDE